MKSMIKIWERLMNAAMIAIVAILPTVSACGGGDSSGTAGGDGDDSSAPQLLSLKITCAGSAYGATIDQSAKSATVALVGKSTDISAVEYTLSSGASIKPDPKTTEWKINQKFYVSKNNQTVTYTVKVPNITFKREKMIVGYLPLGDSEYDNYIGKIKWQYLTHIIMSSATVQSDGTLYHSATVDKNIDNTVTMAHNAGVKAMIQLYSYSASNYTFHAAISDATTRATLVKQVIAFAKLHKLDGVDINYEEHNAWDINSLTAFAKELYEARPSSDFILSAAITSYDTYSTEFFGYLNFVDIMSYDNRVYSQKNVQHSKYEDFTNDIDKVISTYNLDRKKVNGGIPFYGYSWDSNVKTDSSHAIRYYSILYYYGNKVADQSEVNGVTFYNGRDLVKKKCQYAIDKGCGGVMVFQLFQDAHDDEFKLLKVIGETLE